MPSKDNLQKYLIPLTTIFIIAMLFLFPGCDGSFSGLPVNGASSGGSTTGLSVTLSWKAPNTNSDGSLLQDLAGYKVYYGSASGQYSNYIDVGSNSNITIGNLQPGKVYLAVTAYDTAGNESGYSQEVYTDI